MRSPWFTLSYSVVVIFWQLSLIVIAYRGLSNDHFLRNWCLLLLFLAHWPLACLLSALPLILNTHTTHNYRDALSLSHTHARTHTHTHKVSQHLVQKFICKTGKWAQVHQDLCYTLLFQKKKHWNYPSRKQISLSHMKWKWQGKTRAWGRTCCLSLNLIKKFSVTHVFKLWLTDTHGYHM